MPNFRENVIAVSYEFGWSLAKTCIRIQFKAVLN